MLKVNTEEDTYHTYHIRPWEPEKKKNTVKNDMRSQQYKREGQGTYSSVESRSLEKSTCPEMPEEPILMKDAQLS